jgi:uncharacterized membrane protein
MVVQPKRHIAKTISYRIISSASGFLLLWLVTGDPKIGATFSFSELMYKPVIYFFHERVWYRYIKFGLKEKKIAE